MGYRKVKTLTIISVQKMCSDVKHQIKVTALGLVSTNYIDVFLVAFNCMGTEQAMQYSSARFMSALSKFVTPSFSPV